MSEAVIYVAGIGVTALIFGLILYYVKEDHPHLRFFMVMVLMTLALMMTKTFWDARTECETVVANSTDISSVTTTYEYTNFCYTTTTNTPGTFQTIIYWSYYVMIGYVLLNLLYMAIKGLLDMRSRH